MTFQQFLKQGQAHGSFYYPEQPPPAPLTKHAQSVQVQPPAAEPVKMKAISAPLNNSLTAQATTTPPAAQTNRPLDLKGSDGRLEVLLPGDALDFSHAALSNGAAPGGGLTLQITQLYGHYIGERNILGSYQIQVVDSQGQVVHNIRLRQPVTIRYHYQPWEMTDLALDSGQLMLSWPNLIVAARDAGQPTDNLEVPLTDDVQTHTLTAQTMVLGPGVVDVSGTSQIQPPPKPLLASVSGNAGQLSYGYPLSVAPGPNGFAPQLQLSYSSESTNERYSQRSPASSVGEGWSLSLGSISAENYPFGSTAGAGTWYFLSGVSNVSDRLIPAEGAGFYDTMHISHLRLQFDGNCFHIWDRSGYYYELGCTSDSRQYMTDAAHKRTNYLWDVDRIVAPYNSTSQIKEMFIHYLQDSVTTNGRTTIRDAGIKQIQYGYANALGNSPLKQVVGTVDFHYHAPNAQAPWADAYGTNYHCSTPPPRGKSTTLRCDDPIALGGNAPPDVMSTLTLDSVTSYVGSDSGSGSYPAYRYDFSYHDTFTTICYDPLTLVQEYCAATHQLTSIVPTVYQHGTAYKRKGVVLGYTGALHDTYYDPAHQTSDPKQEYGGATFWTYLNSFEDLDTGVGEKISYGTAYGNTNGTPYITDSKGNIVDDRLDPLYCWKQANNPDHSKRCDGVYKFANAKSWSLQVVTQIQAVGKDSSSSDLPLATTTYNYQLAITAINGCHPITGAGVPPQEADCVGEPARTIQGHRREARVAVA